jgi:hypothetical protein
MVKIKHKELSQILNLSEKYTRVLLYRRRISLKQVDIVKIVDLIVEYKMKNIKLVREGDIITIGDNKQEFILRKG